MPSCSRQGVVAQGMIGVYHCWNRCVQRAWLCGRDPATGKDYEYRRLAIEHLQQLPARLFAIDVGFHAEHTNHIHWIVRTRTELAASYSDDEASVPEEARYTSAYHRIQTRLQSQCSGESNERSSGGM